MAFFIEIHLDCCPFEIDLLQFRCRLRLIDLLLLLFTLSLTSDTFLQIDQAALGLSREYLTKGHDDKIVQAYYSYMVDVAVIYGADRKAAKEELMEALNFEMKLANVSQLNFSTMEEKVHVFHPKTLYFSSKKTRSLVDLVAKWKTSWRQRPIQSIQTERSPKEVPIRSMGRIHQRFAAENTADRWKRSDRRQRSIVLWQFRQIVGRNTQANHCQLYDVACDGILIVFPYRRAAQASASVQHGCERKTRARAKMEGVYRHH